MPAGQAAASSPLRSRRAVVDDSCIVQLNTLWIMLKKPGAGERREGII